MTARHRDKRADYFDLQTEIDAVRDHVIELITEAMEFHGLSRTDLARRLGVSLASVSEVLRGARNIRLTTLVEMLYVMDCRLHIEIRSIHEAAETETLGMEP